MNLKVSELMTPDPIAVPATAGFKEMVERMEGARISALPVVDGEGRVIGVVSEADLLLKQELVLLETPHFFETPWRQRTRRKALGEQAADVMSSPAITVGPEMSVVEAARVMHRRRVKRLPVVDGEGRLVGILSRADVLRVFMRGDEEIRREVMDDVVVRSLWLDPRSVAITVHEGIVELGGEVDRRSDVAALTALAQAVTGVVAVRTEGISYRYDDSHSPAVAAR